MSAIIDASALLAVLLRETGADFVLGSLRGAPISAVNLAECFGRAMERGRSAAEIDVLLARMDMEVVPFTDTQARRVAELRPASRHLGLSLGDRACLALAGERGLMVLTGDRRLASFVCDIDIRMIR